MKGDGLASATRFLVFALAGLYGMAAVVVLLYGGFDSGRTLSWLVFLLGGVTEAPLSTSELADEGRGVFLRGTPEEAGSFSLTGAPATSNNITIDGLDNNDDRSARERITLNVDSIAEVQIITNQYAAEYGRASGGRINIRTRAGANSFHGDGSVYFGDESLNANTYFRNARGLGRVLDLRDGPGLPLLRLAVKLGRREGIEGFAIGRMHGDELALQMRRELGDLDPIGLRSAFEFVAVGLGLRRLLQIDHAAVPARNLHALVAERRRPFGDRVP